jgi:hypothetical protein
MKKSTKKPPVPCSERGTGIKTTLDKGTYAVRDGKLYYRKSGSARWKQLGDASWENTTGIAAHKGWLYLIQDGKLHRVNPSDGTWYPKPLDGAECQWYLGWPGPIWSDGKNLYAIRNGGIEKLYFDKACSKVVQSFPVDSITV